MPTLHHRSRSPCRAAWRGVSRAAMDAMLSDPEGDAPPPGAEGHGGQLASPDCSLILDAGGE
ncbi:MAG: hypothetical protein GZ085_02030 [Sulfuriferula multivorans]|uniref:Uncharacterized protein n=1 Tax=Sulfuriferula multivorans TaxID=1559896 RepID=A0A7C9P8B4_9PROT|nr:hypothetical protein [Sulfuriferula multivorans]